MKQEGSVSTVIHRYNAETPSTVQAPKWFLPQLQPQTPQLPVPRYNYRGPPVLRPRPVHYPSVDGGYHIAPQMLPQHHHGMYPPFARLQPRLEQENASTEPVPSPAYNSDSLNDQAASYCVDESMSSEAPAPVVYRQSGPDFLPQHRSVTPSASVVSMTYRDTKKALLAVRSAIATLEANPGVVPVSEDNSTITSAPQHSTSPSQTQADGKWIYVPASVAGKGAVIQVVQPRKRIKRRRVTAARKVKSSLLNRKPKTAVNRWKA